MGFDLKPLGWEDALPGKGRPQEVINKDVEQCDLFVMLLWNRWGTPPGGSSAYTSGTEEEFELARKLDKQIFLYFRDVLEEMLADAGPELERVLGFRKKIEAEKQLLFSRYRAPTQWDEQVMEHIARWLDGFQPIPSSPSARIPPEVQARISELEEQIGKLAAEHKDAQTKLREIALELGKRAAAAAGDGRLTEAEELFAKATQTYPEPWVINALGLYYRQIGSLERAGEKFRQVEQLGKEQGNKEYLAVAYGNLGLIYQTRGDLKTAEEMHRKSLALEEELGRKEGMASDYGNLGLIYQTRGDLKTAEEMLRKSLALNEQLGRKQGMASQYGNLGLIYQTRGDLKTAEEMLRESLALHEELGHKEGMASDYGNLGGVYQKRGELEKAEEMVRKGLALFKELGAKLKVKQARRILADIRQQKKESRERSRRPKP